MIENNIIERVWTEGGRKGREHQQREDQNDDYAFDANRAENCPFPTVCVCVCVK